jgi:hypothetical protein
MKEAKKKYYGILTNGKFYAKGFDIIQHVMDKKIKNILEEIYIMLMDRVGHNLVRNKLAQLKSEFFKFSYEHLGQELRLANDPDKYETNIRHARAADYSNKYLNTNFKAGSTGKLIMIREVKRTGKYPNTDVVFLDENTKLPEEFKVDYDLCWEKLVLDKIRLLEDIEEMRISEILNKNKSILDFV